MKSLPVRQIGILALVVVCFVAPAVSAKPQTKTPASSASKASEAAPTFQKTIGNPNAPITMEVFGDFECPACRGFFETRRSR